LYANKKLSPEDETELINKVAKRVHDSGLDIAALIMLQTFKPLSYIGGEMSRFMFQPFLPIFGENIEVLGSQLINVFEKKENIELLIARIEELEKEEAEKKKKQRKK
jgi:hypothetical protein